LKPYWWILSFFVACMSPLEGLSDNFLPPEYRTACPNSGNVVQPNGCQPITPAGLAQLGTAVTSSGETAAKLEAFIETMIALDQPVPIVVSGGKENSALAKMDPGPSASETFLIPPLSETRSVPSIPLKQQTVEGVGSTGTSRMSERGSPGPGWTDGVDLYATKDQTPPEASLRSPSQGGETSPSGLAALVNRPDGTSKSAGSAGTGMAMRTGSTASPGAASTEESADPLDYFNRTSVEDSLFEMVHKRYKKKAETWARISEKI
jgi:hypothetical protein